MGDKRHVLVCVLCVVLTAALPAQEAAPAVPSTVLTFQEADNRLDVAERMIQGGVFDRARDLANSVLDDPAARAVSGSEDAGQWLERREKARFLMDRARFGLAGDNREELLDVAAAMVQLANNRYRLPEPVYNVQAAYWAGRAYEEAGDFRDAVEQYGRVGGISLPPEMEGDAARRMSRSMRLLAEQLPYPGTIRDRQQRDRLLNQAIAELDRARLAFPVGDQRKEIELERIALRMASRDEQFIREAASEAEAFIESDPAKDEARARAALYRGNAASLLGNPEDAVVWFRRVLDDEAPSDEDRRQAALGVALALRELSESRGEEERRRLLDQASRALDSAVEGTASPGRWDGARVVKAQTLLDLGHPTAALLTLLPILNGDRLFHEAWQVAGMAELSRGRLGEAFDLLYPTTRPSNPSRTLRYQACRDAATTAEARRDFGLALAVNHQASRMLRRNRLFSSLLVSEFQAMEILVNLGKMGGPVSLSSDADLLMVDTGVSVVDIEEKRAEAMERLAGDLGRMLGGHGNPDVGYDLAISTEAALEWQGDGRKKLELAIAMIAHLRRRQPAGVTDSVLLSHMGDARHALALAMADDILESDEPSEAEVDLTLGNFAAASANFQEASLGGRSLTDSLDQGMVNMESGAFLMRLAERWNTGPWASRALVWREEARLRIEASLRPFNQAIATSGPSSLASRRAKWSRGRALELMGEYRGAAADYLSLMNNSELPRILRANAARRWAACMAALGDQRQALTRLAAFADIDAESALLSGRLAEESGYLREAYQRYLFAADPSSPSLPPATPGRAQQAAYHAARLALANPNETDPLTPAATVIDAARLLLERNAAADLDGRWAVPMLELLGDSYIGDGPDGWRRTRELAQTIIDRPGSDRAVDRAMYTMAARALTAGGDYDGALDALDEARERLDPGQSARQDAADITLETARIYRLQNRIQDSLRAYADVFAVYPESVDAAETARMEAARMVLSQPNAGPREREQARGILSGLRDQTAAERILREFGIR